MTKKELESGVIFLVIVPAGILVALAVVCDVLYNLVKLVF